MYDYSYYNSSNLGSSAAAGVGIGLLLFYIFFCLAIYAFSAICLWKVFKKAGRNGWEAIIPIYNTWVLFEISGYPGYYILFALIPCVGGIIAIVFEILASISLAKKFKKESWFPILLILVPVVGYAILGFGKDTYDASLGDNKITK